MGDHGRSWEVMGSRFYRGGVAALQRFRINGHPGPNEITSFLYQDGVIDVSFYTGSAQTSLLSFPWMSKVQENMLQFGFKVQRFKKIRSHLRSRQSVGIWAQFSH